MAPPNLLPPVHNLLNVLSGDSPDINEIQKAFTSNPAPSIHEHGLSFLAPFLGRTFTVQEGVHEYFALLFSVMRFRNIEFDPSSTWIVDNRKMIVSLRGSAVMTWNDTNMRWNETFLYRLEVSQDISPNSRKSQLLISDLQIWADTGAAFLARIGRLYTAELVAAELASEREYEYWEPSENDDDNDETSLVSSSPSSGGSVYSAAPVHGTPFVPASGTMAIARRAEAQAREHRFHREPEPERTL